MNLLLSGTLSAHRLEKALGDHVRAVRLRRRLLERQITGVAPEPKRALESLPVGEFDYKAFYEQIDGANCESVVGYVPVPVGVVGPLRVDGRDLMVPMATTEGALLASTNRGCRAISASGGAVTVVTGNGMTRAPLIKFPSAAEAARFKVWAENPAVEEELAAAFNSTTRFGRMESAKATVSGRNVFLRFKCFTGDAMGMNMITKGTHAALEYCKRHFPEMEVLALSGNMCTDKKPSAINWVDGRGKSVTAEVRLSKDAVEKVLKSNADALVEVNYRKNLVGSAMAGSVGGFNAHASNILTAVFLATGQDCAQNVESSNCITLLEHDETTEGGVIASVTMPSIEVGTVGGGTSLPAQAAALDMLGVRGAAREIPGANAEQLARVVASSVLAGELSLLAAMTTNDLLSSHMKLNRKPAAPAGGGSAPAGRATHATAPHGGLGAAATSVFHGTTGRGHGSSPPQLLSKPVAAAPSAGRRSFAAEAAARGFEVSGTSQQLVEEEDWPRCPVP